MRRLIYYVWAVVSSMKQRDLKENQKQLEPEGPFRLKLIIDRNEGFRRRKLMPLARAFAGQLQPDSRARELVAGRLKLRFRAVESAECLFRLIALGAGADPARLGDPRPSLRPQ